MTTRSKAMAALASYMTTLWKTRSQLVGATQQPENLQEETQEESLIIFHSCQLALLRQIESRQ